jgi:pSer/pThr/pTyr-binding forkhead associated (FHA) protein
VLNLIEEDEISMGRGHDIFVRVTDISVSRCHAFIKKSPQGFFYMLDNNSKFGSLALVRQPTLINSQCNNVYQIGKTLIMFAIERAITALDPWNQRIFSIRKMFGCFAPSSNEHSPSICCCKLCFKETLEEFQDRLKENDLNKELMQDAPK